VGRGALAEALVQMSQVASHYASRQRGSLSAGFSIAIPLAAALSDSYSGSHGRMSNAAAGLLPRTARGGGIGSSGQP
jgi:hypothetical protein